MIFKRTKYDVWHRWFAWHPVIAQVQPASPLTPDTLVFANRDELPARHLVWLAHVRRRRFGKGWEYEIEGRVETIDEFFDRQV